MTQDEIIELSNQASKEWAKEYPTPEETAHQVPKRFLEIFAKLCFEKGRQQGIEQERAMWQMSQIYKEMGGS